MSADNANRLHELRKKHNLSKDELAEKIFVDRETISEWERAESTPDDGDLLQLAHLYDIPADELLEKDNPNSTTTRSDRNANRSGNATPLSDSTSTWSRNSSNLYLDRAVPEPQFNVKALYKMPVPIVITFLYLLSGFVFNFWHPGWMMFLLVPIYYQMVAVLSAKTLRQKLNRFPIAVACLFLYLFAGLAFNFWHPSWMLFLFIPIYYILANAFTDKK